jgi:hypothetical protein
MIDWSKKETFLLSDGQLEGIIRNLENSIDDLRNVIDAGKCAGNIAGKIEELLELCYAKRTEYGKDSKRVNAYGESTLNDYDLGECRGWMSAMEFVIFYLELIKKEEV